MTNDPLVTTTEISARLGVSRQTVSRWIREGRLEALAIEVGSRRPIYRIRESQYRAFLTRYVRGED
jgi:excisionase family DNA binding protein